MHFWVRTLTCRLQLDNGQVAAAAAYTIVAACQRCYLLAAAAYLDDWTSDETTCFLAVSLGGSALRSSNPPSAIATAVFDPLGNRLVLVALIKERRAITPIRSRETTTDH